MGNDGGVVAVKRKFMRHANTKAKAEKVDQENLRMQKATTCAISEQPLREPIVACKLGNLYNKEALLEHLLARTLPERFHHICSLKDVVTCRFTRHDKSSVTGANGNSNSNSNSNGSGVKDATEFYCPITMVDFNGAQPFVVMAECGCVLSERAIKEVTSKECLVCGKPFKQADHDSDEPSSTTNCHVIRLFLPEDQYAQQQKQLMELKAAQKLLRKDKKATKKRAKAEKSEAKTDTNGAKKKRKLHDSACGNAAAVAVTGGVSKIAQDAVNCISKEKAKSAVFASLFTKEKQEKKSANELLMTIGGMRYTLS